MRTHKGDLRDISWENLCCFSNSIKLGFIEQISETQQHCWILSYLDFIMHHANPTLTSVPQEEWMGSYRRKRSLV